MLKIAKKYILAFPKEKEKEVLDLVETADEIEVIGKQQEEVSREKEKIVKKLQETDYLVSSLGFAISYLTPYAEKMPLLEKIKNPKILIKKNDLKRLAGKEKIKAQVERVVEIEKELETLEREKKENNEKLAELENFGDLSFVPQETEQTFSFVVSVSVSQAEGLFEFCFKNKLHTREIYKTPGKVFLLLVGLLEGKEKALEGLKDCKAEIVPYNFKNQPKEERRAASAAIEENKKRIQALKKELARLALAMRELKIYHDLFSVQRSQLEIKKRSFDDGFLNYVLFWAQERKKEELEKEIKKVSPGITVIETKPDEGENPPVLLENSRAMRPFEYVTEIFGMPRNDELDPTPYLSLFFILFFGICLTDAGYGFLMALLTGLALLFLKNRFSGNKLIKLLFYGGISTLLAGVVFGSYFGTGPEVFGMPFMARLKMIDPIQNTVWFMGMAFFLGYLQLVFAQLVKIISGRKNKNTNMILSGTAWGLLYIFGGMLLLSQKVPFLKTPGILGVVGAALFILVAESQGIKIFFRPLVGAIKMLQGLIGTMSDILSYSRLMALGLATAVIALIVNQIATLFAGMIPYVGWVLGGLILIGGHLFNLGINALGGFIHSGRLQFVEFFPKFLEGGGRRLEPIKSKLKYIKVE